ncbi:hypothetical protein TNCV_2495421 [Trichonephila clavipes]|nr:hypothetical protein TNCV_2495421 [Trichonephila clavipes]
MLNLPWLKDLVLVWCESLEKYRSPHLADAQNYESNDTGANFISWSLKRTSKCFQTFSFFHDGDLLLMP